MNAVTISSSYQITIPREIREKFNLKPRQKLMFIPYDGTIHLVVVRPITEARGSLKGMNTDVQREEEDRI